MPMRPPPATHRFVWFAASTYMTWVVLHNTAMLYITSRESAWLGRVIASIPFFAVGTEFALIAVGFTVYSARLHASPAAPRLEARTPPRPSSAGSDRAARILCYLGNWMLLPLLIAWLRARAFDRKEASGEWKAPEAPPNFFFNPVGFIARDSLAGSTRGTVSTTRATSAKVHPAASPTKAAWEAPAGEVVATKEARASAERRSEATKLELTEPDVSLEDYSPEELHAVLIVQRRVRQWYARKIYLAQLEQRRERLRRFSWPIAAITLGELVGNLVCQHYKVNEPDTWGTFHIIFRLFWWLMLLLPPIGVLLVDKFVLKASFSIAHGVYFAASLYRACYNLGDFDSDFIDWMAEGGWGESRVTVRRSDAPASALRPHDPRTLLSVL